MYIQNNQAWVPQSNQWAQPQVANTYPANPATYPPQQGSYPANGYPAQQPMGYPPQGFNQQYPSMAQPYINPQQQYVNQAPPQYPNSAQPYVYPTMTGPAAGFQGHPGQPRPHAQQIQSGIGKIYTGSNNHQQQIMGHQPTVQAPQAPANSKYPMWLGNVIGIPLSTVEAHVIAKVGELLRSILKKGGGNSVLEKYISEGGLTSAFIDLILDRARKLATVYLLKRTCPNPTECIVRAATVAVFGTYAAEIAANSDISITSYSMMLGADISGSQAALHELLNNEEVFYHRVVAETQEMFDKATTTRQQPQQSPMASIAKTFVNTNNTTMRDPMDVMYDKLVAERRKAAEAMVDYSDIHIPLPESPVVELLQPEEAMYQEQVTPTLGDGFLYNRQTLRVHGIPYSATGPTYQYKLELSNGSKAFSLIIPQPLDPFDRPAVNAAVEQHLQHMENGTVEISLVDKAPEYQPPQPVMETIRADLNQPAGDRISVPATPKINSGFPAAFLKTATDGFQSHAEPKAFQQPTDIEAPTTPEPVETAQQQSNFGYHHTPPPYSYHSGAATVETNQDADDAFKVMLDSEEQAIAKEVQELEDMYGKSASFEDLLEGAREQGIEVKEPELTVDYLGIEPASRRKLLRDLQIRKVPAYLKGVHNLNLVTRGDVREVVLEEVESVDYLRHENEYHHVNRYPNWDMETRDTNFKKHVEKASRTVWTPEQFVENLNNRIKLVEDNDPDTALTEIIADCPLITIEGLLTKTSTSDDYQIETIAELGARGVEGNAAIVETSIVNYNRLNTSSIVLEEDNRAEIVRILSAGTANDIIRAIQSAKQNTTIPIRELARLLKKFNREINASLAIEFCAGWSVKDALTDRSELLESLIRAYPHILASTLREKLDGIYVYSLKSVMRIVDTEDTESSPAILGDVENITLLPFYHKDYPLAMADEVAYLSEEQFPELVALLKRVNKGHKSMRLVTMDNVVMTIQKSADGEFFLTEVDA